MDHHFTMWIHSIILDYSSNLSCILGQFSENYYYISQKDSQRTKICLLLKLFSPCVDSLNPVYNSASFNPSAYFQCSNITLLATAFTLNRNFPPWFIYIQETIQVTQCKYFWIIGNVIVQNHIHSIFPPFPEWIY